MDEVVWNERYKVGVELIDNAHQKLFSLVRRLLLLSSDDNRSRFACEEGVKFLKNYTLQHFAEEEAYMRQISYIGYEEHRQIHQQMREEKLLAYEKELAESEYSHESVQHFLGFCIGWLTGHIMTEDHDITRKKEQMFVPPERLLDVDTFGLHVQQVLKDLFGLNAKVANPVYNLEDFGKGIYYCLIYRSEQGKRLLFSLLLDENLVLKTVSEMPGIPFDKIDNVVLYATRQMARHVLKRISAFFRFQGVYRFEKDVFLDEERFHKQVNVDNPYCSLLFETQYGPMAICVNM